MREERARVDVEVVGLLPLRGSTQWIDCQVGALQPWRVAAAGARRVVLDSGTVEGPLPPVGSVQGLSTPAGMSPHKVVRARARELVLAPLTPAETTALLAAGQELRERKARRLRAIVDGALVLAVLTLALLFGIGYGLLDARLARLESPQAGARP